MRTRGNPDIPADAIAEAIRKLTRTESPSLVENKRRFHRMLTDGVPVEYHADDGRIVHDHVWLIHLADADNNDWLRAMVKRLLRKHGYPPDKQEKATRTVLEQAELLCKDWAARSLRSASGQAQRRRSGNSYTASPKSCASPGQNSTLSFLPRGGRGADRVPSEAGGTQRPDPPSPSPGALPPPTQTGQTTRTSSLTEIAAGTWADLDPIPVRAALQARADRLQYNPTTYNLWLGSVQQFCRWAVREGLADRNPLASLRKRNGQVDRRRQRRALTETEAANLITVTGQNPRPCKMPGPDRAWLYALMLNTGLRIGEAGQLRTTDLHLTRRDPYLIVRPEVSKHRSEDVIPLPIDFAEPYGKFALPSGADPIFPLPATPSRWFRRDLRDANIDPFDGQGRVIDLHALRHTYVTNLVRTGAHPKVVQQLARHSSISMTMDVYSHVFGEEVQKAVRELPAIVPGPITDAP